MTRHCKMVRRTHYRSAAAFASAFHMKMLKARALAPLLSAYVICDDRPSKGECMKVTALVVMMALVVSVSTQADAQRS